MFALLIAVCDSREPFCLSLLGKRALPLLPTGRPHFALLSILSVTVHRDAHVVATPGPEDRSEVRCAPRHILGEKKRYMHISVEKAPPVLLSIGSAFVFNWKRKQSDDIIIAINTMIDILWTLAMY